MGPKDLRLGQIVYILVFYNILFSWLLPLDGFQFNFLLRDSENDLYTIKFFFGLIKIPVVAKSSLLPLWLLPLLKCWVARTVQNRTLIQERKEDKENHSCSSFLYSF